MPGFYCWLAVFARWQDGIACWQAGWLFGWLEVDSLMAGWLCGLAAWLSGRLPGSNCLAISMAGWLAI
jgi:hypothetical protein